jgi:uncharacterized protein YbjT (DUF2867 family)
MILVTGATGQCGGALVRVLRGKGVEVRALTRGRDPAAIERLRHAGAEIVVGDLLEPQTLRGLFDGVEQAFLVTTPQHGFDEEVAAASNCIAAAEDQKLRHLVFLSVVYAETDTPHCATKGRIEARLRRGTVPYTILRAGYFLETLVNYLRPHTLARGTIESVIDPAAPIHWTGIDDVALAVARVFERNRPANRAYDLISPDACSMNDVAEVLSGALGRRVSVVHKPVSIATLLRGLVLAGYAAAEPMEAYLRHVPDRDADYHGAISSSKVPVDSRPLACEFGLDLRGPLDYLRQLRTEGRLG